MGMSIHIDASDALGEIDRLARGPGGADLLRLDAHLMRVFAETQAVVHIITGSLLVSGRPDTSYRDDVWRGQITYGGPAAGAVHNPVKYAGYELARGDTHDFMRPWDEAEPAFGEAVLDFLRATP